MLVSVSEMAEIETIIEHDINPLIVTESGVVAVDARVMVEDLESLKTSKDN